MFAGSHLIRSGIFRYLPDQEEFGIVDRVYQPLLEEGRETIAGMVDDGLWFDIGTMQRYLAASRGLLGAIVRGEVPAPAQSFVDGSSLLHKSATGHARQSIIGARTTIRGDVRDSVVWDDCTIEGTVRNCVIGHGVKVTGTHENELILGEGVFPLQ